MLVRFVQRYTSKDTDSGVRLETCALPAVAVAVVDLVDSTYSAPMCYRRRALSKSIK